MANRIFNIRVGLVVMFGLLIVSYVVLVGVYAKSLYEISEPTTRSPIEVLLRDKEGNGSTITVPDVVTVGVPFVYETKGEKLVENGAILRFQIDCNVGGVWQVTTLSTIYSDIPKGRFDVKRYFTIDQTLQLEPSDKCTLRSVATYTFYVVENKIQHNYTVTETGRSNVFKLIVPTK